MKKFSVALLILLLAAGGWSKDLGELRLRNAEFGRTSGIYPAQDEKTHQVGSLYLTVTNYGFFGSQRGDDTPTFCIISDEEICGRDPGNCRPSAEYPGCSGIEYLFMGALWIGAVVGGDTLVSVGEDGWQPDINELFPSYNDGDTIIKRSVLDGDSGAVSEEDYVCNFADTLSNTSFVPPDHRAIGIAIHQESYAWSYDYAHNFVFIDYTFKNVRTDGRTIRDLYIGLYIDGDVGHVNTTEYAQDDVTGFIRYYITDAGDTIPLNLAWLADNDGDPEEGAFTDRSPTGAMAVKLLRAPGGTDIASLNFSYNWWISNTEEDKDWGPMMREHDLGFDGTPEGDINKYKVMANGEFDYDQTEILDYYDNNDWFQLPDRELAGNLCNGYDTRFLLSFGPLELPPDLPDSELPHITIAFMVGENFHTNPNMDTTDCSQFKRYYNFQKLAETAYWAQQIFDNGYRGPEPPPAPEFKIVLGQNKATILWKNNVESVYDSITHLYDFEGYRIYIAEENIDHYYVPLVQYDRVDFLKVNRITEYLDSVSAEGDSFFHYDTLYSDTLLDSDDSIDVELVHSDGTTETIRLKPQPFDANLGMPPDTVIDGETWYYYVIDHLLPGDDKWVVVTAFDYGQPSKGLASLECNKTKNSKWFVPSGAPPTDKKVRVVPNPYRVDHDYKKYWEHSFTSEWTEYSRKLRFYNLPKHCTIRIYTLDGDLVKEIEHDESVPGTMVGAEDWNLISRNDQAIVSGIYV
ncbi:MAG TPA: hypothetical protein ENG11_02140, partial [candidate division Zixibacteria bacterium]|nr:hypothetical protein [candidate division Zixibacteria bacterium]